MKRIATKKVHFDDHQLDPLERMRLLRDELDVPELCSWYYMTACAVYEEMKRLREKVDAKA